MLNKISPCTPDLTSIIAHDLANYVSSLRLTMFRLRKEVEVVSREQLTNDIHLLSNMIDKVTNLIVQMLEARRRETNLAPRQLIWVNAKELLDALVLDYQIPANVKQITLVSKIQSPNAKIYTDEFLLKEILGNLISNAIKYSYENSTVTLHLLADENSIYFGVEDDGQGLTNEDMSRLFRQFTSLSAEPTNGEPSFGMGLYIVKQLTTLLGGQVWAESRGEGQGAIFNLIVPHFFNRKDI